MKVTQQVFDVLPIMKKHETDLLMQLKKKKKHLQ